MHETLIDIASARSDGPSPASMAAPASLAGNRRLSSSDELRHGAWLQGDHKKQFGVMGYPQRYTPIRAAGVRAALAREISRTATPATPDIYAFGVYTGSGMWKLAHSIKFAGHLWGFDSFQGIPEEQDPRESERNFKQNKHFRMGGYSAADALGDWNATRLMARIVKRISAPKNNVTLIRGYFNESLTPTLAAQRGMRPALLVDIDVDIYTSTYQALEWMIKRNLVVPGTYVRYDDWPRRPAAAGPAKGTLNYGQALAHHELTAKYGIKWSQLDVKGYGAYVFKVSCLDSGCLVSGGVA